MLKQEKELRGQTQALTWTAEAERASATGRRRTVQLGCGLQAAGMLKREKELRGQTHGAAGSRRGCGCCCCMRCRCHFLTGRGTLFEASIPDCSFNVLAAAHMPLLLLQRCLRVRSVVRPLCIPVHLNQIYKNEVSLSAKYGLCRKGDCKETLSTSNLRQIN